MRICRQFAIVLGLLSSICTLLLMAILVTNIVLRNGFASSVPAFIEIIRASMVCIVFLGLALTDADDGHIRLRLLTDHLPPRASAGVRALAHSMVVITLGWMAYGAAQRAQLSFEAREIFQGAAGMPLWPFRILIVFGLLAALLIAVAKTVTYLRRFVAWTRASAGGATVAER